MTFTRPFLRLLALGAPAFAAAIPPHPTMLLTEADSARVAVVKVIGTDPVVQLDGKEKRIRLQPTYFAERAPYFGPGRITFASISLNGFSLKAVARYDDEPGPSAPLVGGGYEFEARLTPTVELKGAFIAVVIFNRAFLSGAHDHPSPEILVNALPDLPAHRESTIKVRGKISNRRGESGYFPLIFSAGGAEVRSSISHYSAHYFTRVEQVRLAGALTRYRAQYASADQPATPVLTIQPLLPDGVAAPGEPVVATATVGENGHVSDVSLPPSLDPRVSASLREALSGWLFLPRLKSGQPVATRIQIPLKF